MDGENLGNTQGNKKATRSVLLGAAFLMATSSIGPGFLTQTTVFTQQLAASFGFVILISLLLNVFAQIKVWSIIVVLGFCGRDISIYNVIVLYHVYSLYHCFV